MEIHHTKHHQAYVDKVNKALEGTEWDGKDIDDVLQNLDQLPADKKKAVQNNGGGHYNHSLFWTIMGPPSSSSGQASGKGKLSGDMKAAIDEAFGSFEEFQKKWLRQWW
jgi:Fe-Mn family superoxide dismutase